MLQAAFRRPSNSSVSTLHLRSDHISNSHSRDFLLVSMMGDTTAFIRRMMRQHHLSCPSWLPQSEPGVIPLCQSPSTLQTRTDTVVFLITHPAASYFQTQPWPQLALGHHGIRSQLLHSQTCPGPGALRQIHVSKRDSKRLSEMRPMSWWALLFNHIVTTQDESANSCVTTFKKKYSAWKKKQPFAEPQMPPQH